jgi:DNA repair photolyase
VDKLRTSVTLEAARTIITRNSSPDIPFNRSINAYRGCEHGCIYCYARPSHAYLDLSPGLDFETKLFAKPDAAALLRRELGRRGYVPAPIAMGTNTTSRSRGDTPLPAPCWKSVWKPATR